MKKLIGKKIVEKKKARRRILIMIGRKITCSGKIFSSGSLCPLSGRVRERSRGDRLS